MRNQIVLLAFSFLLFSCPSQKTNTIDKPNIPAKLPIVEAPPKIPPFEMELPDAYTLLAEATGDLNKDKLPEKVLVLNTGKIGDMGEERMILVFKVKDQEWQLMHRATGPVLLSEHGGLLGDPFQSIAIDRGAIVVKHLGGSRDKWNYTHRYRFQNNKWELICATTIKEAACTYRETFDYNLSTGEVAYNHIKQTCEDGTVAKTVAIIANDNFMYKMPKRPSLNGFIPGSLYAIHPTSGKCVPESNCYDYQRPVDIKEIVGIYTLGGHHESWALKVVPKGTDIEVKYYVIDGMLPPQLAEIDKYFTANRLDPFDLNWTDGTFDSELGKGRYRSSAGIQTITFFDIGSHIEDQLVLTKG